MTIFAGHKFWFQVTPMARAQGIAVIPRVLRMMLLCSAYCCNGDRADDVDELEFAHGASLGKHRVD